MKGTVALAWDERVVVSPHIGEMDSPRSLRVFEQVAGDLQSLYGVTAERLICDAHSGYTTHRWARDEGYAKIIPEAVQGLMAKLNITMDDVDKLVFPCFFKGDHKKIAKQLGATPEKLVDNMHEVCGETGAAHAFMMFISALETAQPGERILLVGFGQGANALYFRVTDNIQKMAARSGVAGSLANKKTTDNYLKWLKFRDLLKTEMGIRAEAPTQTATTVLWHKNKMLLGLVGGKCRECGTPQYPKMDYCVNPACGALHSQDDYEFADAPAKVKSFTGDMLAISVDPPAIYGMVQFEGGGRLMADFTDCTMDDVTVGADDVLEVTIDEGALQRIVIPAGTVPRADLVAAVERAGYGVVQADDAFELEDAEAQARDGQRQVPGRFSGVDVGTLVQQQPAGFGLTPQRRPDQGRPAKSTIGGFNVGAAFKQETDDFLPSFFGGDDQRVAGM